MDHQLLAADRADDELVDGALAHLVGSVDVEGADPDRWKAALTVVGIRQVLARELGDGVAPARLLDRALPAGVRLVDVARGGRRSRSSRGSRSAPGHGAARRPPGRSSCRGGSPARSGSGFPARYRRRRPRPCARRASLRTGLHPRPRRRSRRPSRARRVGARGTPVRCSAFRVRSSKTTTSLSAASRQASLEPMNPAPPVIRTRPPQHRAAESMAWVLRCALCTGGGGAARWPGRGGGR